jgi:hypothetical protein
LKPAEYLLYVFISNLKFYFFLKFEATTILTQGAPLRANPNKTCGARRGKRVKAPLLRKVS